MTHRPFERISTRRGSDTQNTTPFMPINYRQKLKLNANKVGGWFVVLEAGGEERFLRLLKRCFHGGERARKQKPEHNNVLMMIVYSQCSWMSHAHTHTQHICSISIYNIRCMTPLYYGCPIGLSPFQSE